MNDSGRQLLDRGKAAPRAGLRILAVAALACACTACSTTVSEYVAGFEAYSVVRGTVVKVENLTTESQELLSDGSAMAASAPGCRVTVRFADQTEVLDLDSGSVLVFGLERDYILRPIRPASPSTDGTVVAAPPPVPISPANGAPAPPRTADPVLSIPQEVPTAVDSEAAQTALGEARARLAKSEFEAAREAFERAYALDPFDRAAARELTTLLKQMGLRLYAQGKLDQAVAHWQRAREITPEDTETRRYLKRAETVSKEL